MSKRTVQVETREAITSTSDNPQWRAIVTTSRGRCYSTTYAGDRPDDDKVRRDWESDRKGSGRANWIPYRA